MDSKSKNDGKQALGVKEEEGLVEYFVVTEEIVNTVMVSSGHKTDNR